MIRLMTKGQGETCQAGQGSDFSGRSGVRLFRQVWGQTCQAGQGSDLSGRSGVSFVGQVRGQGSGFHRQLEPAIMPFRASVIGR